MPWHALWLCAMTLMVVGSSDPVRPQVTPAAIEPALLLSAGWVALSGLIYVLFAFETRNRSLEEIDAAPRPTSAAAATGSGAGTRMA